MNFLKFIGLVSVFSTQVLAQNIEITVYNGGQGFVKEKREFDFKNGKSELKFKDIAAGILPTSVHFQGESWEVVILEQNYAFDLVSIDKIFEKYLEEKVSLKLKDGQLFEGKLLAIPSENRIVIQSKNGLQIVNTQEVLTCDFPELPEGLISKPELAWLVNSQKAGKQNVQLSYLTSGLDWHADYVTLVNEKDTEMELTSWITVNNFSGKTYKNATLKVVAGSLNKPPQNQPIYNLQGRAGKSMAMEAMQDETAQEESFFEYHLYTIPREVTIKSNEEKQVTLFADSKVKIKKEYRFSKGYDTNKPEHVDVILKFKNSTEEGLGLPLPQGVFRIYKADSKGSNQLVGEDIIQHTPKNEFVKLKIGEAFDVVGERKLVENKRITDRINEETIEFTLRNHKEENIDVIVEAQFWGNWEIKKSNFEFRKDGARKAEFTIPVKKDGTTKLEYTVRYSW
ncbi:DUF4139 domain-containing protein [bacterium]|nr:DUF4139 domain-containing protein [bacterium]